MTTTASLADGACERTATGLRDVDVLTIAQAMAEAEGLAAEMLRRRGVGPSPITGYVAHLVLARAFEVAMYALADEDGAMHGEIASLIEYARDAAKRIGERGV